MDPNSKEFKKLKASWYKKLAASGFDDIERMRNGGDLRRESMNNVVVFYTPDQYQAKSDYYRLAGQFLHDYNFETTVDKTIWELHTAGIPIREIVTTLQKQRIKTYKDFVHQTVKRLAKLMVQNVGKE